MKLLKLTVLIIAASIFAPAYLSAQTEEPKKPANKAPLLSTDVKQYDLPVINEDSVVMVKTNVERELVKLTVVDKALDVLLDSIITNQKKCGYDPNYCLWKIEIEKKNGNFFVIIDISYVFSQKYEYLGFFKKQDFIFLVKGKSNPKIFKAGKKQEVKYAIELPSVALTTTPRWVYIMKDNKLQLVITDSKVCQ